MTKEKKVFDFIGKRKIFLCISLAIIIAGIIANIFLGTQLDINFKGGTVFNYSFSKSELSEAEKESINTIANEVLQNDVSVNYTTDYTGEINQFKISMNEMPKTKLIYSYTLNASTTVEGSEESPENQSGVVVDINTDTVKEAVKQTFEKDFDVDIDGQNMLINITPDEDDDLTESGITSLTGKLQTAFPSNSITLKSSNSVTELESNLTERLYEELGTKVVYTYTADSVDSAEVTTVVDKTMGQEFNVVLDSTAKTITLTPKDRSENNDLITTEKTKQLTSALSEEFSDAGFALSSERYNAVYCLNSNAVKPSVGKGFFIKCIFAIILAAIFIVLYVGIRFRKIGGVSAGLFSLLALVHDIVISYFVYVVFRIPLDSNFIAVVLTILGYSLNATIIIYDRIRENKRIYGNTKTLDEIINISVSATLMRNIFTTLTTSIAVVAICVVAYFTGLDSIISFALPMSVGVLAGCYSSVLLSSPCWALWRNYREKSKAAKRRKK